MFVQVADQDTPLGFCVQLPTFLLQHMHIRCHVARDTHAKRRYVRVTHARTSTGPLSASGYGEDDGISTLGGRRTGPPNRVTCAYKESTV